MFSTSPSAPNTPDNFLARVTQTAAWSEKAGCTGILIYADNAQVDPWLIAQAVIQTTRSLCPLVATQPVYMHPFAVAKMISTLGFLYGRRVYLNMIAGGFKNDLTALNDPTPHDRRYERLTEYTLLIKRLLEGAPVTVNGAFYSVTGLTLRPRLAPELFPGILASGSSEAGVAAARAIGATPVKYPEPPGECDAADQNGGCGLRIGIIARPDEEEAWAVALKRFPEDRKGQLTHELAMKVSDSAWHQRLSEIGRKKNEARATYWLHPFETHKTFCPYLVGSYRNVAKDLASYQASGFDTFILDIPAAEEEFEHTGIVFRMAAENAETRVAA